MMAGAEGFEPSNGETKTRCLTAWRRPNIRCEISTEFIRLTQVPSLTFLLRKIKVRTR